jgi:uncharacterized RDD family membrane protein YckC
VAHAAWSKRVLALLFDLVIFVAMLLAAFAGSKLLHGTAAAGFAIVGFTVAAAVNFYNKCVLMGRTGQTWGKRFFGFGLIREATGRPMGLWRAIVRELAHAFDYLILGIGFLMPLWDAKGQTVADKMMKTMAVDMTATPVGAAVMSAQSNS